MVETVGELDYVSEYEPRLRSIRVAQMVACEVAPDSGYVADFATQVPVSNRAGRMTGRAFSVSVEPGSILTSPRVRVEVHGAFRDGEGFKATVTGSFYVGCVADLPPAEYAWEGDLKVIRQARAHMPASTWFPLLSHGEIEAVRQSLITRGDLARAELCVLLEPMLSAKAQKAAGLLGSGSMDVEDFRQEMLIELLRGLDLFASSSRPDTSVFSWMDRYLWRACEKVLTGALGLSRSAWSERKVALRAGAAPIGADPRTVALNEELAAPQPGCDSNGALRAFRESAPAAGLTARERRVFEFRHHGFDGGSPLPWSVVARKAMVSESTCKRVYAEGKRKLGASLRT